MHLHKEPRGSMMAVQLARSFPLTRSPARRGPWNVAEIRGIGGMHAGTCFFEWIIPLEEGRGGLQSLQDRHSCVEEGKKRKEKKRKEREKNLFTGKGSSIAHSVCIVPACDWGRT